MPYRADADEGPTAEDLERFGEDGGHCPECGNHVHDLADICPACGAWITGDVSSRDPVQREIDRRARVVVVLAVLIAFTIGILGLSRIL